jgi:hypothetical protein
VRKTAQNRLFLRPLTLLYGAGFRVGVFRGLSNQWMEGRLSGPNRELLMLNERIGLLSPVEAVNRQIPRDPVAIFTSPRVAARSVRRQRELI